jgi:hypothetical protein
MRGGIRLLIVSALALTLTGCAQSYPGLATPKSALDTFFTSAQRLDYATTYDCYYGRYHDLVPREEFLNHRKQAAVLMSYRIEQLAARGSSADATLTLTFAAAAPKTTPRIVTVNERLVNEAGAWKVQVW